MENIYTDAWDRESDRPGFRSKRRRLLKALGGELLGGTLYLLPPGEKSFPYHAHHANEELLIVLEGEVSLRSPAGESVMSRGDVALFARGREGAHQVINRSEDDVRYLMLSSMVAPEIVEYPDSGNVGLFAGTDLRKFVDGDAERDYYHGEA